MEDELDDKIIYQTYVSHMKIVSRVAWSVPLNTLSPITYTLQMWRLIRLHIFRPEMFVFGLFVLIIVMYMQAVNDLSRNLIGRLQYTLNRGVRQSKSDRLAALFNTADIEKASWETKIGPVAAYAIQGRRPKMEDRFVINDNINNTGVALFAVFDGHGGEFAANYAKDKLVQNLFSRVVEIKDLIAGKISKCVQDEGEEKKDEEKPVTPQLLDRRKSLRKTSSTAEECTTGKEVTDSELLTKLDNLIRPITREVRNSLTSSQIKKQPSTAYFDNKSGIVDYGKLLTDEVLLADKNLVAIAKKSMDVAGTTALIAILEKHKLIVANVGDSRGIMCDSKGNAIPLSFDHKPQQVREHKRIKEAGGFVAFNGVWRVAGILATSRALGDYPLKDKRLVIADPDILTFDLDDHKPLFVILASDGLWDTFSNEEAVSFVKERLNEADYGAKSLTLQAYFRGSLDNITVIIINFKDNLFSFYKK